MTGQPLFPYAPRTYLSAEAFLPPADPIGTARQRELRHDVPHRPAAGARQVFAKGATRRMKKKGGSAYCPAPPVDAEDTTAEKTMIRLASRPASPPRNVGKEIRDTRRTESGKRPRRTHALREQSPVSSIGSADSAYSGIRAFSNAFRRGGEHTGEVDDFRSQERARSLRSTSAKRTGLRCPEPRTARHPKARKPKNVPAGRMQFEKAGSLPKRENGSPKANHFVKPSAEPNSFELCRGGKWTK